MAEIVARRLVEYLARAGFIVMTQTPPGGHSGLEARRGVREWGEGRRETR
jgi:hypothetical protein